MKISDISVSYIQHCGDDLSIANAARVSFHKESEWEITSTSDPQKQLSEKDVKLINYLAKHKHFSPFNHSFITLRVKAPIFVARQLVKHKFMPINEVSRRYVTEEPEFYFPEVWRKKADNVKQGSSEEVYNVDWDLPYVKENIQSLLNMYEQFINTGMCPEQARMILPQNMMTEWWWSGTLGAYCDMLRLRLDSHTQKETQDVAKQVRHLIEPLFPVSVKALLGET